MELAMRYYRLTHTWRVPASWMPAWSHNVYLCTYLLQVMQEYLIASSHSSAVASAEHTGKGVDTPTRFVHNNSRARGPLLWSIATKHSVLCYWWFWRPFKKIETVLFKTRNMQPDYRERVIWNVHSVVAQCLYLPTSMLLLTLAMMGAWALEAWASCAFSESNFPSGY